MFFILVIPSRFYLRNSMLKSTNMKSFLFIVLLINCSLSFAQMTSNTKEGIDTRWISVEPNMNNTVLFQTNSGQDSLIHLIDFVEKLTKEGAPIYYLESNDFKDKTKYYVDIEPFPNKDSVRNFYADDYVVTNEVSKTNNFIVGLSFYIALKNSDGYDIIVMEGGDETALIAPVIYSFIQKNEVTNIRIREEMVYDANTFTYSFKPVGIYLAPQKGNNSNFEIWIDFNRLTSKIKHPESYDWFNFINERKYMGFQYKQSEKNENQYFPSTIEEYSYDEIIDEKTNLKLVLTKRTVLDSAVSHIEEVDNNKFITSNYRDCTYDILVIEGQKTKFIRTFKTSDFINIENAELAGKVITTYVSFVEYNKNSKKITLEYALINPVTRESYQYYIVLNKDGSFSNIQKKKVQ